MTLPVDEWTRICRGLWRSRGFLTLAACSLAIGLAIFAGALAMAGSLLGPPPFAQHRDIVLYGGEDRDPAGRAASPMFYVTTGLPQGTISHGAAQVAESANVQMGDVQKLVRAQRVDAGFLPTLGVASVLPEDPSIDASRSVMLSHGFWRTALGGNPRVVGQVMSVNGTVMTIRGVLPQDYRLLADIDLLMPLSLDDAVHDTAGNLMAIARLAPGASPATVTRWIQARVATNGLAETAACRCVTPFGATPLDGFLGDNARPIILQSFVCSLLILAMTGFNLSNLMLTRALRHTQEACLMVAFGGRGWRARLRVMADVTLIGTFALLIGLPLASLLVAAGRVFVPESWLISALPITLDLRTCVIASVMSFIVATAAAFPGAVHESPDRLLRAQFTLDGTQSAAIARRARRWMVLAQTALATLLLVFGVATASRFWQLMQIQPGFDAGRARLVEVSPDAHQFPTLDAVLRAIASIRADAMRMPGAKAAGVSTLLPVGRGFFMPFRLPDRRTAYLRYALVSPGAMEAMGMALVSGRTFGEEDTAGAPLVAMVNQAYLDKVDAQGRGGWVLPDSRLAPNHPLRIVGVVADARGPGAATSTDPVVFVPFAQVNPRSYAFIRQFMQTFVLIRGAEATLDGPSTFGRQIERAAPGLAAGYEQSLRRLAGEATAAARRNAALAATLSTMALALAGIGLYAVQSLEVTSRRRDLALRGALGATPLDLLGHIVSRGIGMAVPGIVLGLIAAIAVERVLEHAALPSGGGDVVTIAAAALLMIGMVLAAVAVPALRAAAVRPVSTLRDDPPHARRPTHRNEAIHS